MISFRIACMSLLVATELSMKVNVRINKSSSQVIINYTVFFLFIKMFLKN